jgi:hypothetical protein
VTTRDYTTPILVMVFCDDCGVTHAGQFLVPAGQDSLEVARAHMARHLGWRIIPDGDFCPDCVKVSGIEELEKADTMHVYPLHDLVEHLTCGDGCVCVPRADPVKRDDGSVGWVMVHHSLDGREAQEQAAADEFWRWENFKTIRRGLWCRCRQDSLPHVWLPADHPLWPSGHERVPPSLHWELGRFQDDARHAGIIPKPNPLGAWL